MESRRLGRSALQKMATNIKKKKKKLHALAYEALVNCVKGHELRRISVMETAHDMWVLLDQAYGRKSSMRLTTAQLELRKLVKQPTYFHAGIHKRHGNRDNVGLKDSGKSRVQ